MSVTTDLAMIVGRGNRVAEAGNIGHDFVRSWGPIGEEALYSVSFDEERGHTLAIITSEELRRFFLRHTDWVEWAFGEPYPL